ncbi:MAG: helix-turn-helix domain-containing protein [Chitinophagales bacterium]
MTFYIIGVILAFFLAFILLTKKGKSQADYILAFWLSISGFHLFGYYIYLTGKYLEYPDIIPIVAPFPLLQGPCLYLYTLANTSPKRLGKIHLLHLVPALVIYCLFAEFFFLSFSEKVEITLQEGGRFNYVFTINIIAIYFSGFTYDILSLVKLLKYRRSMVQQFSNTDKINFNWLLYLIIWIGFIWVIILFVQSDYVIFGTAVVFIGWLGYFGIKQVKVFSQPTLSQPINSDESVLQSELTDETEELISAKYQTSNLSVSSADEILQRLQTAMREEKLFTNPELTLDLLAKQLKVNPNNLSQVINSKMQKSFYDYINALRIEEFLVQAELPENRHLTILAISFDCGFNSKASFYRNFKKIKGVTPSEYISPLKVA